MLCKCRLINLWLSRGDQIYFLGQTHPPTPSEEGEFIPVPLLRKARGFIPVPLLGGARGGFIPVSLLGKARGFIPVPLLGGARGSIPVPLLRKARGVYSGSPPGRG